MSYRYYACELKATHWKCERMEDTKETSWNPSTGTLATTLVPVSTWIPTFLDPLIVSSKLKTPVLVRNTNPSVAKTD